MNPERVFEIAQILWQEDFGNDTKITAAYMEKVLNWPKIENVSLLQDYALWENLTCLLISKLSFKNCLLKWSIVARFSSIVAEKQNHNSNFNEVVHLAEHQVIKELYLKEKVDKAVNTSSICSSEPDPIVSSPFVSNRDR